MTRYRSEIIVSLFLIVSTLAVWWQVRHHEFLNFDDNDYIREGKSLPMIRPDRKQIMFQSERETGSHGIMTIDVDLDKIPNMPHALRK